MKRFLAIVIVVAIILLLWFLFFKPSGKSTVIKQSTTDTVTKKHSPEFDKEISSLIDSYMAMKNAFANGDTSEIKAKTNQFITSAGSVHLNELQEKDSSFYLAIQQNVSDIKANAAPILQESDISEMRRDFSMVCENVYPFLKTVGYEGQKLYWQNDPNAFGEDKPANWLSISSQGKNPYAGKKDANNLHSVETMDSIYAK
ncbi:MAG: DUF3347 domain-containing protein [Ginsengibacter sp.]